MHLQPVIQRELTVVSRRVETWRLRVAYGFGAVGAFAFAFVLPDIQPNERGQVVLICLAACGFTLSLFTGPYLTADSVSSEKREGTLGLLFLTPLNGWHIITGKMLTHALQVSYALLGVFPLFFLPLMLGGVLWTEVARVALVLLLTLLLSLACGIVCSTISTEARHAVLGSALVVLLLTFLPLSLAFVQGLVTNRGFHIDGFPQFSPMTPLIFAFEPNFRLRGAGLPGVTSGPFIYWASVAISLACSLGLLGLAGWLLPRVWRRAEAGERPLAAKKHKGVPAARKRVPGWAPALRQSPLLWLASRDLAEPAGLKVLRILVLVFFAWMLLVAVNTKRWEEGYITAFCIAYGWHLITRMQLLLAATRRLHEERRSGALETLLSTPVTDFELTAAHHESLKQAFRKPLLVLLALNAALQAAVIGFPDQLHMGGGAGAIFSVFWIGGAVLTLADFAALRWMGLCEALRSTTQMKAVGRVFGWLFGASWLAFAATFGMAVQFKRGEQAAVVFAGWVLTCLVYDFLLIHRCLRWLAPGFRRRAAEGPAVTAQPSFR